MVEEKKSIIKGEDCPGGTKRRKLWRTIISHVFKRHGELKERCNLLDSFMQINGGTRSTKEKSVAENDKIHEDVGKKTRNRTLHIERANELT